MNYYKVNEWVPGLTEATWEDVLFNFEGKDLLHPVKNTTNKTITRKYDWPDINEFYSEKLVRSQIEWLHDFNARHADLFSVPRESLYRSYKIPKRSGGLRQIDEPLPPLMNALCELRDEFKSWGLFHHTAAYAYIEKRCTIDALKIHRNFNSVYYLKTDLKNFFGSTTPEFVMKQISKIYPFCFVCRESVLGTSDAVFGVLNGYDELKKALLLAFYHGGLPQGTPISPFLTNLIMIPIDHDLAAKFAERRLVYTRYADDMLISGREQFPYRKMVDIIRTSFTENEAPYTINDEKTRYGSRLGSNYNLGLCTNAENNITVGYKNKKFFKAMVNNLILDTLNGKRWEIGDVQHVRGLLSYYMMVEEGYFKSMIEKYNEKYNVNFYAIIKSYLS